MVAVRCLYLPSELIVITNDALELSMFKFCVGSSQIDCKSHLHILNDVFCYTLRSTIMATVRNFQIIYEKFKVGTIISSFK
jgi:hypothetical protein